MFKRCLGGDGMKNNQLKGGAILSYIQMALGIGIGLIYTPVMIRLLGQSEYGLYNTVSSTISMMSVLSLGFNASYIRFFSKYRKQEDQDSINRLNGLFLFIYSVIAIIVLICGFFLTYNLQIVFDNGLNAQEYKIAKVLMMILTMNLAISFPMSVFSSIISAYEEFMILKILGIGKTVISPLVTMPLLLMGYKSIAMVIVTVSINLLVDICYIYVVLKRLKQKFLFDKVEKGLFKDVFSYTFFIAINMIVDQINWNVGKFLLGRYQGTIAVSIYSVGYSLYHYYHMFSTAISSVFTPCIHKIVVNTENEKKEQKKQLTALFIRVGRIQFMVLSLIATGIIFFGKPFILNIWAGKEYIDSYMITIILVLSSSIALIQNIGIEIQRALNCHQFRSIVYILMAIVNLTITIILCPRYGAVGAAIGTANSLLLANGLIMNIYYHKKCNINIVLFWKNIFRVAVGIIPSIIVGIIINCVVDLNQLWILCMSILLYICIYTFSMWLLGMNPSEKKMVLKLIKGIGRGIWKRGKVHVD